MTVHTVTSFRPGPPAHVPDTPWDHRAATPRGPHDPRGRRAHRFPAATYLTRAVAREERTYALQQLATTGRAASRRIGGVAVVIMGLLAAMVALVATGNAASSAGPATLGALGGGTGLAIVALVVLVRRHDRLHARLADRVRRYEGRLLELRAQRPR